MADENFNDYFPELKELESKLGRKTPESLLSWMKDAADCGDGWRSDEVESRDHGPAATGGSISDKISSLKEEMRWLRSADVRILRQLVAVHEGIEAMRWLMEERGNLASRGSSLTGSLSSLVTMDEHMLSLTPNRGSPSPTYPQDLPETSGEGLADQQSPHTDDGDINHKTYFDVLSPDSSEARPPSPFSSKFEVSSGSTRGDHGLASSNPANGSICASLQKSPPQDLDLFLFPDNKAATIKRALLRSRSARRGVKLDASIFTLSQELKEVQREQSLPQESVRTPQNNVTEEEPSPTNNEKFLLGYDAQWSWVESQDDVTFL